MTAAHILDAFFIALYLLGAVCLLRKLLNYLNPPTSDNRSEHFPDGEWRG